MKQQLSNYSLTYQQIPILYDDTSAINLIKNPIMHSETKHIQIHHHFIQDHVQRDDISLKSIQINFQLVDTFTKPHDGKRFVFIRRELDILDPFENDLQ